MTNGKPIILNIGLAKVLGAAGTLIIVLGGLASFLHNDLKGDIREIRDDFKALTKEDGTIKSLLSGEAKDLRKEISEAREASVANKASLATLAGDVAEMKATLREINKKLAAAPVERGDVISYALNNKMLYRVGGVDEPLTEYFKKQGIKIQPLDVYTASPVTADAIYNVVTRQAEKLQKIK